MLWYLWKMTQSSENRKEGLDAIETGVMRDNCIYILVSEKIVELLENCLIDGECLLVG